MLIYPKQTHQVVNPKQAQPAEDQHEDLLAAVGWVAPTPQLNCKYVQFTLTVALSLSLCIVLDVVRSNELSISGFPLILILSMIRNLAGVAIKSFSRDETDANMSSLRFLSDCHRSDCHTDLPIFSLSLTASKAQELFL